MKKLLLPFIFLAFLFQSCVNDGLKDDNSPKALPRTLTSSEQELIASSSVFSYEVFQNIVAAEESGNVFISPLSISMALGMTLNGAAGETQVAIKETLNLNELKLQAINQSYQSLIDLLINLDHQVDMNIGNSLWSRQGFSINQTFKDTLQTYFDARVEELDFSDPAAANVINDWVNEQTNGRIEKIISGSISPQVVLYLINAIYFKADWLYQFDTDDTKPADFYLANGSTVQADMMNLSRTPMAAFRSDEVQMLELPYGDSLFTMTVLLPANAETPIEGFVQQSLTASNMEAWIGQLATGEIDVFFPKFETEYEKNLNDILKAMGMASAFDGVNANFSDINSETDLYISEVMHKANITVNEEGSEAAAVTSVAVVDSAPPSFMVNRPFVYLIRERISGTVLFMGMMNNPSL